MVGIVPIADDIDDVEDGEGALETGEEAELTPFVRQVAVVASISGLLFGLDSASISCMLVTFGTDVGGQALSIGQEELVVAGLTLGALLGAIAAGWLSDRFGRKRVILLSAVLFTLGAVEQAAAQIVKELVLGRVIVGLGVGLASMVTPVFLSELCPSEWRGRVVTLLTIAITFGQVVAFVVGAVLFNLSHAWRWIALSCAVPAVTQIALSFRLPESPRWCIAHNRVNEARSTLARIYPSSSPASIDRKIEVIQTAMRRAETDVLHVSINKRAAATLVDALWRDPATRRALIVACGLQATQQLSGFNLLMYYSARFLRSAGFNQPAFAALPIAVVNCCFTAVSLRLIDRVGRRPLLLRSLSGMVVGHVLISLAFIFIPRTADSAGFAAYLALIAMVIFTAFYASGVGNVPWVIQSEIFSMEVRAIGNGMATAVNWSTNLLATGTFLHLADALTRTGVFLLYAFVCILAWSFVYLTVPETAGMTIEECRKLFERGDIGGSAREARAASPGYSAVQQSGRDDASDPVT